jgi:hypothetical protein
VLADAIDRRKLMLFSQVSMCILVTMLAVATAKGATVRC